MENGYAVADIVEIKHPMPVTNDEHTSSLISLALYTYLDPVILLGAKVSHLKYDQLPPLMDTDYSENLIKRAFPVRSVYPNQSASRLKVTLSTLTNSDLALTSAIYSLVSYACSVSIYLFYFIENVYPE